MPKRPRNRDVVVRRLNPIKTLKVKGDYVLSAQDLANIKIIEFHQCAKLTLIGKKSNSTIIFHSFPEIKIMYSTKRRPIIELFRCCPSSYEIAWQIKKKARLCACIGNINLISIRNSHVYLLYKEFLLH
jgi:hypothetical protein